MVIPDEAVDLGQKVNLTPKAGGKSFASLQSGKGDVSLRYLTLFASNTEFFRNRSFTLLYKSMRSAVLIVGICIRKLGYS